MCGGRGAQRDCNTQGMAPRHTAIMMGSLRYYKIMFRAQLPRAYELKDLTRDPGSPDAYFKDFETKLQEGSLAKAWFTRLEKKLQYLPEDEWTALKKEACPF